MRSAAMAFLMMVAVATTASVAAAADEKPAADSTAPTAAPDSGPATPPSVGLERPKSFPKLRQASLLHKNQLGIAIMPGVGFRGVFPYQEMVYCGQMGKRVCTGVLPFFMDVQPAFGFAEHWDVLVDLRFGIGTDFNKNHEFAVAPGVRYWVDPELPFKFYATIQGVFDATAQPDPKLKDNDFGIRNANGFMFEVMRNLGFYFQFGETLGFVRWLRFEIDGGVGVQARIP